MSSKQEIVNQLIPNQFTSVKESATAFAPINIALAKYWGKRDIDLHLPVTDSFSVAINAGTKTTVAQAAEADIVSLNDKSIFPSSPFYQRLTSFLDLFRPSSHFFFSISTRNSIPTAAGLASSASGFAALVLALNQFFGWELKAEKLSILARLGSGSACRSIYSGFVHWKKGSRADGMDSFAIPIEAWWEELAFGTCMISDTIKPIDSRKAMEQTVKTSPLYQMWPQQVERNLHEIEQAVRSKNFSLFGRAVEQNALCMHATMLASAPPICYWQEGSLQTMRAIWRARNDGLEVYFTMDAGPNVKLFFLQKDQQKVAQAIPSFSPLALLAP